MPRFHAALAEPEPPLPPAPEPELPEPELPELELPEPAEPDPPLEGVDVALEAAVGAGFPEGLLLSPSAGLEPLSFFADEYRSEYQPLPFN
jgi:hypothetical protein